MSDQDQTQTNEQFEPLDQVEATPMSEESLEHYVKAAGFTDDGFNAVKEYCAHKDLPLEETIFLMVDSGIVEAGFETNEDGETVLKEASKTLFLAKREYDEADGGDDSAMLKAFSEIKGIDFEDAQAMAERAKEASQANSSSLFDENGIAEDVSPEHKAFIEKTMTESAEREVKEKAIKEKFNGFYSRYPEGYLAKTLTEISDRHISAMAREIIGAVRREEDHISDEDVEIFIEATPFLKDTQNPAVGDLVGVITSVIFNTYLSVLTTQDEPDYCLMEQIRSAVSDSREDKLKADEADSEEATDQTGSDMTPSVENVDENLSEVDLSQEDNSEHPGL